MANRDFHFKYENSLPIKKKRKPKNPAPPINAKRNPSAVPEEVSEFDEAQPAAVQDSGEVYIDLSEEENVKVYERKNVIDEFPQKDSPEKKKKRILLGALILGIVGALFVGIGICIAVFMS